MERKAYTVKEAAEVLNFNPAVIRRKIDQGILKAFTLGGDYRIPVSEVDRLLAVRDDDNNG